MKHSGASAMGDLLLAQSDCVDDGVLACLVYIISPIHVISSLAALKTLYPNGNIRATFLVHWPGVNDVIVTELTSVVREMTSTFENIERIVMITSSDKNELLTTCSLQQISQAFEELLGSAHFDELYYAHDIEGGMQQLLCTLFPEAKRICYGDALGNVYEKKVHLSFLSNNGGGKTPTTVFTLRQILTRATALGCRILKWSLLKSSKILEFSEFRPDAATLILPVDQSGKFLEGLPLNICSRENVLNLVERCARACGPLRDYQFSLVNRYRGRKKYLLLTENSAEGNFIDFHRETEMYCAVIREQCEPGSVIFLKSHPGEILPRNEKISQRLADDFEVVTLKQKLKRYPIELWMDLITNSTVICMSYPVLSLKYLYGIDVIQPMDDAFIERWFPEWTWASYKNSASLYMEPLKQLEAWDGKSVLWSARMDN